MGYFPIFINLENVNILVVGGGQNSTNTVKSLLLFNASPKIIAPEISPELKNIIDANSLEYESRKYQEGELANFDLVFVETEDKEIELKVKNDAKMTRTLINFFGKQDDSTFFVPSYVKRGDLVISISTQRKAPFLSRYFRDLLDKRLSNKMEDFVKIADYFFAKLIEKGITGKLQDKMIDEFPAVKWLDIIEDDGVEYAKLLVNHLIEYYV